MQTLPLLVDRNTKSTGRKVCTLKTCLILNFYTHLSLVCTEQQNPLLGNANNTRFGFPLLVCILGLGIILEKQNSLG